MTTRDKQVVLDLARAFAAATQPESLDIIGPILRDALTRVWPLEVSLESVLGYDPDKSDWSQLRDGDPASDPEEDEHPDFLEGVEAYAAAPVGTLLEDHLGPLARVEGGWRDEENVFHCDGSISWARRVIKWGDR